MQKNETGQLSYNLYKNKLKMTRDLNIVPETIKLPEENIGNTFFHTRLSNVFSFFFLYTSPQARVTKAKANKWVLGTLKIFYIAKETIKKMKRQPTEWDNIFANNASDKKIPKINKLTQLSIPPPKKSKQSR